MLQPPLGYLRRYWGDLCDQNTQLNYQKVLMITLMVQKHGECQEIFVRFLWKFTYDDAVGIPEDDQKVTGYF